MVVIVVQFVHFINLWFREKSVCNFAKHSHTLNEWNRKAENNFESSRKPALCWRLGKPWQIQISPRGYLWDFTDAFHSETELRKFIFSLATLSLLINGIYNGSTGNWKWNCNREKQAASFLNENRLEQNAFNCTVNTEDCQPLLLFQKLS